MRIEQEFENDPTDLGIAWAGDWTVAEVREERRAAAKEQSADPGPVGRPASASHRRRVQAQLARERGWDRGRSDGFRRPCPQHSARPGEWCRIGGRRLPGQLCTSRRDAPGVSR